MRSRPKLLLALPWTVIAACSGPEAMAASPDPVVATMDGETVTQTELEEVAAAELASLAAERQKILEAALDRLIEERLLAREAKSRGLAVEALVAIEIDAKLTPVTDDEVTTWYTANQQRVRQPLEQVREPIRNFLAEDRRRQTMATLVKTLRARYDVVETLPLLRQNVSVADAPSKGPAGAPVTIVEFSDFECPYCRSIQPEIEAVRAKYGEQVRLEFRHYPLASIHPRAEPAARAAVCANAQGKFWQLHDLLFANQRQLGDAEITAHARAIGLDTSAFAACLAAAATRDRVARDQAEGARAGVGSTPTLFVNGRPLTLYNNRPAAEQIGDVIDDELARARAGAAAVEAQPAAGR